MRPSRLLPVFLVVAFGLASGTAWAQAPESESWPSTLANHDTILPNITYLTANNYEAKLDLYRPNNEGVHPTLVFIHGGGWVGGSREGTALFPLPFLQKDGEDEPEPRARLAPSVRCS